MINRCIIPMFLVFTLLAAAPVFAQEQKSDCPTCHDTGKVVCPECKADREFWCSECAERSACSVCDGLGWILCPECGGKDAKAERDFLLAKRSRHHQISETVGTRLRQIETPRFRLYTDIEHTKSHQYALMLETYARRFNDLFDKEEDAKVWLDKCDVYLFQPRAAFVKFAVTIDGKPEVAESGGYSYPSPGGPVVVLFKEGRSDDETRRTIIHELAHVYLGLVYKQGALPVWVQEGVAQRFEFLHKPSASRRAESIKLVKDALEEGKLMPLAELAEMKFTASELLPYAASWSAVDFLMRINKEAFVEWIKLLKDGQEQRPAFKKAFGVSLSLAGRAWRMTVDKAR